MNPSHANVLASNVVDFGCWLYGRNPDGTLLRIYPAGPGDTYSAGVFAPRVLDATELERRDAPGRLRQALALLAAWQDDALTAAELGAITAAQRIARQAQTETRTAALARIVRRLLITQGLDQ
jgi:hypothetical protein